MEIKKCCICGKKLVGYGNNPWPIEDDGECCDECNINYVIPYRLLLYRQARNEE